MCTRAIACHACAVRVALSLTYGAGVCIGSNGRARALVERA